MKINILLFFLIFFFNNKVYSDGQWTSFLTNKDDIDYNRAIIPEGNFIWSATNGGIVKWDIIKGSYSIEKTGSFFSAVKDWNGVKWFGGQQIIYSLKDSVWTIFNKDNTPFLNKAQGIVVCLTMDNVNKRIICGFEWSANSYVNYNYTILSYNGEKWEELVSFIIGPFSLISSLVVDTINPWNIWGNGSSGRYFYLFVKISDVYNVLSSDSPYGGTIRSLAIDSDNSIWLVGTDVFLHDREKNTFASFSPDITGAIGRTWNIVIDNKWNKCIGSDEALILYDNVSWNAYPLQRISERDKITSMAVDERGNIWMGRGEDDFIHGHGLWRFSPPLKAEEVNVFPQVLKILGNYPNPFNPSTTISFSLSSPGKTELSIYSASGQKVRTLVSASKSAGSHSVIWDGRDDTGRLVSSGVYIPRLTSGKYTSTSKMLLLR